jgi:hypothetical protein
MRPLSAANRGADYWGERRPTMKTKSGIKAGGGVIGTLG